MQTNCILSAPTNTRLPWYLADSPVGLRLVLLTVPFQIQTFYQTLVLIAEYHVDCWQNKHCSGVCCDEFPVQQIDGKSE